MQNLSETLTDSYSPAIILARSKLKLHYSALRHSASHLSHAAPFIHSSKGDIISISMPTSVESILSIFACWMKGLVANPVSIHLTLNETISHLTLVKPKAMICIQETSRNIDVLTTACNSLSIPLYAIHLDLNYQSIQIPRVIRRITILSTVLQLSNIKPVAIITNIGATPTETHTPIHSPPSTSDIALLLSTDGTTSDSKLVPLTHGNVLASIEATSKTFELQPQDCTILVMPLWHAHGLIGILLPSFGAGGTVILEQEFSHDHFWQDKRMFKVTWFSTTPFMHRQIHDAQKRSDKSKGRSQLRFVQSAGSFLGENQLLEMEQTYHCPIVTSLIMTEACHLVATNDPRRTRKLGSVGTASIPCIIVNDKGQKVNSGVGEVCIRGTTVFDGYFGGAKASFVTIGKERWFCTGDIGFFDIHGFLIFAGRKVDSLTLKGGTVSTPAVMDRVLSGHPSVESVAFFGSHERVEVAVVLKDDGATELELQKFLQTLIPGQTIDKVHFVSFLPRTRMGKIQRFKLAALQQAKL